jgi:O-antigen/teichoic acid export membrane protein
MSGGATTAKLQTPAGLRAALRREFRIGERGSLRAHLIRGATGVLGLKVINAVLALATGVLLARALAPSGYGVYAYALAWIQLLLIPTTVGLPALVTREVAVYDARRDWARLRGLLLRANQAVLALSLALMLLAGGATWLIAGLQEPSARTLWLALPLLPLFGLAALRGACLRGLHRVLLAQLPDIVVRPALFVALIGTIWLLGARLTPERVMGLQVLAVAGAFLLGAALLWRSLPREVGPAVPAYATRAWAVSALPFLLMGGLNLVNYQTDLIMLGWFGTAAEVGVYRVAGVGSGLVVFVLGAANAMLAPTIAALHARGETRRLQRVVTQSARLVLLCALPAALALILFGRWILTAVFGAEYAVGATALAILAAAQLANAATGSVGQLLSMTGHERDAARGIALSALINVVLNALLIPRWGMNGAAAASAASLITWNVLLAILVHRRLGLHSTALGTPSFARPLLTRLTLR